MSEANTADLTPPAAPGAGTSLTDGGAASAPQGQGGQQQQSSGAGEGEGAAASGQGAGSEQAGQAGASAADGAAPGGDGGAAQGAPEQYATFTLPEGYTLEGDMLDGVTAIAKAHGMNQEQAQALVDLGVKQGQAIMDGISKQASDTPVLLPDHWAQTWSKQTVADAEIGGQHLNQSMALATRVFATFGTPELAQFLNATGLAHHPELNRFMVKVGKAVSEDTLVTPQGGQTKSPDSDPFKRAASKLYPNMN